MGHILHPAHFLLFFLLLLCRWSGAQGRFDNPIVLNESNGLPSNFLTDVLQDGQGFTWIATSNGVCRFDGSSVKVFQNEENPNNLLDNMAFDLLLDSKAQLWAGTEKGVTVIDTEKGGSHNFISTTGREGTLPEGRVNAIFEGRHGVIWLGVGNNGLVRYSPNSERFESFPLYAYGLHKSVDTSRLNTVLDIAQAPGNDSILWLATLSGLVRFNTVTMDYRIYAIVLDDKSHQHSFNSMRIVRLHSNGKAYLGTWGGAGVFDPATQEFQLISFPITAGHRPLYRRAVYSLMPRADGTLWVTYNRGLAIIDQESLKAQKVYYNDVDEKRIYGGHFGDAEGRIWAISDHGLFIFSPVRNQAGHIYFPATDDDINYIPADVAESKDGRFLYIGAFRAEGLYVLDRDNRSWEVVPAPKGAYEHVSGFSAAAIQRLRDGRIFVLSESGLFLFHEAERRLELLHIDFGVEAPFFRTMAEDKKGNLWIGSRRRGLFRIELKTLKVSHFEKALQAGDSERSTWIETLFCDSRGNIWIRAASGFSVYLSDKDTLLNFPYGPSQEARNSSVFNVQRFAEDKQGRLWIAASEEGIAAVSLDHPEQGVLQKYSEKDGLRGKQAKDIVAGEDGLIWIKTERGLVRFEPGRLNFGLFGPGYGIPAQNVSHFQILSTGELLIPISKGLCIFHPGRLKSNLEIPIPHLTSFRVFGRELMEDTSLLNLKELALSYEQNFFSFEFSAIGYNLPEQHSFVYQLHGVDEDWVRVDKRRYVSYTNIEGGNYQFRLKAANNEGVWSEPYTLNIFISTPWWKRLWFILLTAGLGILAVAGTIRWRIQQLRRKASMKLEYDRKLANVELNALRAQMNPHFIFNCLNSIDYYILKNDTALASDYLNRFSRLIRLILQNSRSEYVNLKDELEALRLYIEMESLRFEKQFDYELRIARGLALEEVEVPPMLLQPYVENAIWHGLMQRKDKGRLDLIITRQNGYLHCVIEDNGIGREAARKLKSKTATRRKSMGMQITKDRLGMINRLYATQATIQVIDLKDEEGNALGTRVELEIPL